MKKNNDHTAISKWINSIEEGQIRSLSQAITLLESTRVEDQNRARNLLEGALERLNKTSPTPTIRIGVSGPPGVGKSSYIESLGMHLLSLGFRVCVLAVDPSSRVSGGSILGDKTRMERLSTQVNAFIRPSPSQQVLGGVTHATQSIMSLCELAGYTVILIETVGIGQSEGAVADMVDCFVLLNQPGSGDELQGIKRGILEFADILLVNKMDGATKYLAQQTLQSLRSTSQLINHSLKNYQVPIIGISSIEETGISESWQAIAKFLKQATSIGYFEHKRQLQQEQWFKKLSEFYWLQYLHSAKHSTPLKKTLLKEIQSGKISILEAAQEFTRSLLNN